MNIKSFAYHWNTSQRTRQMQMHGIIPPNNDGRRNPIYLDMNPTDFYESKMVNSEALLGVYLRGLEENLIPVPDKKWLLCTTLIPPENIYFLGEHFSCEEEIKRNVNYMKFFEAKNRWRWPVRKERITMPNI